MVRTSYLNAKHGIEILHEDGLTQILAGAGDPSLAGLVADLGSIFLRNDNGGGIYSKVGLLNTDWVSVTSSGTVAVSSSGIDPAQHIALHNGSKFVEYTRTGHKISAVDEWVDNTKTYHISSTALNRTGGRVTSFVKNIYDYETGAHVVATVSGVIHRVAGKVTSVEYSRDNLIGGY